MIFKYVEYKDGKDDNGHAQMERLVAYENLMTGFNVPQDKIELAMDRISIPWQHGAPRGKPKLVCIVSDIIISDFESKFTPLSRCRYTEPKTGFFYFVSLFLVIDKVGSTKRYKLPKSKGTVVLL